MVWLFKILLLLIGCSGIYAQSAHDLRVVIGRVGMLARFPDDFFAEDGLAIHDGADLAVGGPQVKTDYGL